MARPRDPTALKVLKGKSHMTKDEKAAIDDEIYASSGKISPPEYLTEKRMVAMFEKEAAYMERVNEAAGVAVYGDTDIEALVTMITSHFQYLYYLKREKDSRDLADKQRYNSMKNKEAATHERFMKLLKLDPSSRVDFGGTSGDDADDEF